MENSGPYLLTLNFESSDKNAPIDSIDYPQLLNDFVIDSKGLQYVINFSVQEKDIKKFQKCLSETITFFSTTLKVDTSYQLNNLIADNSNPENWGNKSSITKTIEFPKSKSVADAQQNNDASSANTKPPFDVRSLAANNFNLSKIEDWLKNYDYSEDEEEKLREYEKFFKCKSIVELDNIKTNLFVWKEHQEVVQTLLKKKGIPQNIKLKEQTILQMRTVLGLNSQKAAGQPAGRQAPVNY